jgi:CheY-like chemotaxis protein
MPPESVNPDPSAKPLRVVLVEDNPRDVQLTVRMLEKAGYRLEFVTAATPYLFEEHLKKSDPQIIICDYNLRDWTAMDALEIFRGLGKDIPFVILSGTVGDEAAAECIKKGATDYLLKDRTARLPSVVARALEETAKGKPKRTSIVSLWSPRICYVSRALTATSNA